MKFYLKILLFLSAFVSTNLFLAENSFALTFSSAEEVCASSLFSENCEVSDNKATINLTSPLEIDSQLIFDLPELEINDLTNSDNSIVPSANFGYSALISFKENSEVTLNNLNIKNTREDIIFLFMAGLNSKITLNNGNYTGVLLFDVYGDSEITLNNVTASVVNQLASDSYRAKSLTFNGGTYESSGQALLYLRPDQSNLNLAAGTFSVKPSKLPEARVFYVYDASSEETKTLIESSIPETSIIYDIENETETVEYGTINLVDYYPDSADEKGVKNFGILNSHLITIIEKDGRGEEETPEEPEETPEESEEESTPAETPTVAEAIEIEENPNTLVDQPVLYFFVVILTTAGLVISAKKYLES